MVRMRRDQSFGDGPAMRCDPVACPLSLAPTRGHAFSAKELLLGSLLCAPAPPVLLFEPLTQDTPHSGGVSGGIERRLEAAQDRLGSFGDGGKAPGDLVAGARCGVVVGFVVVITLPDLFDGAEGIVDELDDPVETDRFREAVQSDHSAMASVNRSGRALVFEFKALLITALVRSLHLGRAVRTAERFAEQSDQLGGGVVLLSAGPPIRMQVAVSDSFVDPVFGEAPALLDLSKVKQFDHYAR